MLVASAGRRGGNPDDGAPDRARPYRPAIDSLAKMGGGWDAVARQGCPGRVAARLRSQPAGTVRRPPRGKFGLVVDDVSTMSSTVLCTTA